MKCSVLVLATLGFIACDPEPTDSPASTEGLVLGALDNSEIAEVVRKGRARLKFCYEAALADDAELEGRMTVKFVIAATGEVSSAELVVDEIGLDVFADCVLDRFDAMIFPPPVGNGIVIVRYPLVFSPA
jgi:hypothetical protein